MYSEAQGVFNLLKDTSGNDEKKYKEKFQKVEDFYKEY
jgi:hypothetical protein